MKLRRQGQATSPTRVECLPELAVLDRHERLRVYKDALGMVHKKASVIVKNRTGKRGGRGLGPIRYGAFTAAYIPAVIELVIPNYLNEDAEGVGSVPISVTERTFLWDGTPRVPVESSEGSASQEFWQVEVVGQALLKAKRFGGEAAAAVLSLLAQKEPGIRAAILACISGERGSQVQNRLASGPASTGKIFSRQSETLAPPAEEPLAVDGPPGLGEVQDADVRHDLQTGEPVSASPRRENDSNLPHVCLICSRGDERDTRVCATCGRPAHHMCSVRLQGEVAADGRGEEWDETIVVCSRRCGAAQMQ